MVGKLGEFWSIIFFFFLFLAIRTAFYFLNSTVPSWSIQELMAPSKDDRDVTNASNKHVRDKQLVCLFCFYVSYIDFTSVNIIFYLHFPLALAV